MNIYTRKTKCQHMLRDFVVNKDSSLLNWFIQDNTHINLRKRCDFEVNIIITSTPELLGVK